MNWARLFGFFLMVQWGRYLFFAGVAYLLVLKLKGPKKDAWIAEHRIQKADFKRNDLLREFGFSTLSAVIFSLMTSFFFSPEIKVHTKLYTDVSQYGWVWFFAAILIQIAVHDTYFYWVHRMMHHPRLFPLIHKVHHLSRNPSPWAAFSFHPIEAILEYAWSIPLLFLIPIHPAALIIFSFFIMGMNINGHLGVELYPESWATHPVMKWMNTSTHHNHHHRDFNGNYGLYFLFWDRWMGTERGVRTKTQKLITLDEQVTFV